MRDIIIRGRFGTKKKARARACSVAPREPHGKRGDYLFPLVSLQVESGQPYHVTTPSFGFQPVTEGKSWIPTNQIDGIQKDR